MKSAPSSSRFYYFQGFKGTFIMGCSDSDKQFKHLWFCAGGRWLHGHLAYVDVPPSERVPLVFRRGYVWTRAPHIPDMTLAKLEALRKLSDLERNQQGLLSLSSLAEHNWFGSSSTSGYADDQPRTSRPGGGHHHTPTGARRPLSFSDRRQRRHGHARSIRSSTGGAGSYEPMADRERRGTKRSSGEDRIARLQKMAKIGKGKGKSGTSYPPSRVVVPPTAPATRAVASPAALVPQAVLHLGATEKTRDLETFLRPRMSWLGRIAFSNYVEKLIEGLCLAFSGSAAARGYANWMVDEVKVVEFEARYARQVEKDANTARDAAREAQKKAKVRAKSSKEWARIVEKYASNAEIARCGLEEALRKAKCDLASAQAELDRYVKVTIPAALEEARAQAVEDFLQSEDFNSKLVAEYQEGMWDMKARFTTANPSLVGVDWSFVPAESKETATEEVLEEGEVSGAARAPEDVVVLDDQEEPATPDARALPILIGTRSWDLTPRSENHKSWGVCKGRSYLGSYSSTSNSDQYLVVGPYSVVQETQEFGGSARADLILGPARALPILVGVRSARSWDLTPWSENHNGWGSAREELNLGHAWALPFGQYPVVGS
ncbi:hypothetical protein TIFTF001_049703 [Ficus carica]|uniref:Uncharacterized protein n=1 Tax=Ficus carica TaxID=3494 RepID=A0AA87ZH06_FICCA|nr:hypothetical protein TIFTF001_049700 [Ficus carica]GMN31635.1 hypothetical protein TIFTF001_049703 [Ficus carica]